MKTVNNDRIICDICQSKRLLKKISIFENQKICNSCIIDNESLANIVKLYNEINSNSKISLSEKIVYNNNFYNELKATSQKVIEKNQIKKEIIKKVKGFKIDINSTKRVNDTINKFSEESLKDVAETIRDTNNVEELKQKTELKKIKRELRIPDPKELYQRLNERVVHQEDAIKALSISITKHFCRIEDNTIQKNNMLLIGPTGTGKTELVKALSKEIDFPVISVDATSFSAVSYKGMNAIETIINAIIQATKDKPENAKKCIVFIDEIDKKASFFNNEHGSGTTIVQQELLTLLQGDVIRAEKNNIELDTSNILIIAAGAFSGIESIINKRLDKTNKIGLNYNDVCIVKNEVADDKQITTKDLIEYGFIPEFVGRFSTIAITKPLGREGLLKVLKSKKDSVVDNYTRIFKTMKIDVVFSDDFLNEIVEESIKLNIGARGLNKIFNEKVESIIFNSFDYINKKIEIGANGIVLILN